MEILTIEDIPDALQEQLRRRAGLEGRSLNQLVILLVEQTLSQTLTPFGERFDAFAKKHGLSPLSEDDLSIMKWRQWPVVSENDGMVMFDGRTTTFYLSGVLFPPRFLTSLSIVSSSRSKSSTE